MPYQLLEHDAGVDRMRKIDKKGRVGAPVKCLWSDVKSYVTDNHGELVKLQHFRAQKVGTVRGKVKSAFDIAAPDPGNWIQLWFKGNNVYAVVATGRTAKISEIVSVVHLKEDKDDGGDDDGKIVGVKGGKGPSKDEVGKELGLRYELLKAWMKGIHVAGRKSLQDKIRQIGLLFDAYVKLGGHDSECARLENWLGAAESHLAALDIKASIGSVTDAPSAFATASWLGKLLGQVDDHPSLLKRKAYTQVGGMTGWLLSQADAGCASILAADWTNPATIERAKKTFEKAKEGRASINGVYPPALLAKLATIQQRLKKSAGALMKKWKDKFGDGKLQVSNLGAARALLNSIELAATDVEDDEEQATVATFIDGAKAAIAEVAKAFEVGDDVITELGKELVRASASEETAIDTWSDDIIQDLETDPSYVATETYGEGAEGRVMKYESRGDGPPLAVKFAHTFTIEHEKSIYDHVGPHPNIVRCFGKKRLDGAEGLVMQACEGGDVDSAMDKALYALAQDPPTDGITPMKYWGALQHIFRGVVMALAHLESKGMGHNDLKGANIAIDLETGEPRIMDFGKAGAVGSDVADGTAGYLDPGVKTGPKRDGFALGSIAYRAEFGSKFNYGSDGPRPSDLEGIAPLMTKYVESGRKAIAHLGTRSKPFVDFANALLNAVGDERPGYLKLLQMPFLADKILDEDAAKDAVRLLGRLPDIPKVENNGGGQGVVVQGGGGGQQQQVQMVNYDLTDLPAPGTVGVTLDELQRFANEVNAAGDDPVAASGLLRRLLVVLKNLGAEPDITAVGFEIRINYVGDEEAETGLGDEFDEGFGPIVEALGALTNIEIEHILALK